MKSEEAAGELAESLRTLALCLQDAEAFVRSAPGFGSEAEQARGYEYLLRSLYWAIETRITQDADHPYFRWVDHWMRGGGDSPDQRYALCSIRGGDNYRIRGSLGSACHVELQLLAGDFWAGTGRSAGFLSFDRIDVDERGCFTVDLMPGGDAQTGSGQARSQMTNPPDGTEIIVRMIYDRWDEALPGELHIDHLGWEGRRKPPRTIPGTAERIRAVATEFKARACTWPTFVKARYLDNKEPNTLSRLADTVAMGGPADRWMSEGSFELAEGQALLVRTWPTNAAYQGIQLTDLWYDSLEHEASSLNGKLALLAPDGSYYHVISATDPGYVNWLDTGGLQRGTIILRYFGVSADIPESQHPSVQLLDIGALPDHIPGFRAVSETEREQARAARRRHLQLRTHR